MKWLEKHLGRYAISNLSLVICILYGFGYLLQLVNSSFLSYLMLDPYQILHGQIWRIVTWLVVPRGSSIWFVPIAILFYYSIGTSIERTWGTVRYNIYIFGGILFTIIGAFATYGVIYLLYGSEWSVLASAVISYNFSTYYIYLSIFLAYAVTFPDAVVLFMFVLPMKNKWLAVLDIVLLAYDAYRYLQIGFFMWTGIVAMVVSLLNFWIFFMMTRDWRRYSPSEVHRRNAWKRGTSGKTVNGKWREVPHAGQQTGAGAAGNATGPVHMKGAQSVHKCAICGRTEISNPDLEFRYCSKCEGGYEYCQDHLFSHVHARNGSAPTLLEGQSVTVERDDSGI